MTRLISIAMMCLTIGMGMTATAQRTSDPELSAEQVRKALRGAAELSGQQINVSTHGDALVLTGEVSSIADAELALQTARGASGGMRVTSDLTTSAAGTAAAQQQVSLVREVEKALRADGRTAPLGIAVSIDDGQVIGLHGLVPSAESRTAAEEVAARVTGVKRVRSHLVLPGE